MTGWAGRLAGIAPASLTRRLPNDLRADFRDRLGLEVPGDLGFRAVPPGQRFGEEVGPPDVVVLGSVATGARRWTELIADHPGVAGVGDLDTKAHLLARFATDRFGPEEAASFARWFPRRSGQLAIHWSPDGLAYPWVPTLLARTAPDARVVVLLGDPIDCLGSDLNRTDDLRASHPGTWLIDAVDRGFASVHLEHLRRCVPDDQILILQSERCMTEPGQQLARTDTHVGLDPASRPPLTTPVPSMAQLRVGERGTTASPRRVRRPGAVQPAPDGFDDGALARLRQLYAGEVERLVALVPDLDLSLWRTTVPLE